MYTLNKAQQVIQAHNIWKLLYREYQDGARAVELAKKYRCSVGHVFRIVKVIKKEEVCEDNERGLLFDTADDIQTKSCQ